MPRAARILPEVGVFHVLTRCFSETNKLSRLCCRRYEKTVRKREPGVMGSGSTI